MGIELPDGADRLPPGKHEATVEEVEAALVDAFPNSTTRRPLFERWKAVREGMRRIVPVQTELLDGSFVTDKLDPGDIDMISVVAGPEVDALDAADQALLHGVAAGKGSKLLHGCDSYLVAQYPDGHPMQAKTDAAYRQVEHFFGHDRNGDAKGIVEVVEETDDAD